MDQAERAKGQAILETLIAVLEEGKAREETAPTHTTIRGHVQTVATETCKRLRGKATRADVLETWLMMHLHAALQSAGEEGEPVQQPVGDA